MIRYHRDLAQGTDEWRAARCGMLTASEMKLIVTPTGKPARNDKERTHFWELLAQRVTKHVPATFQSWDMLRGKEDEADARILYAQKYAPVEEVGFVTNDRWGFTLGCSPDGLVGEPGMIECKSRAPKYQMETIIGGMMPEDFVIQVQTSLLVTEREWCDFVSYCGGLPMMTVRVFPDPKMQQAILEAAEAFEERMAVALGAYAERLAGPIRLIPTERRIDEEMIA